MIKNVLVVHGPNLNLLGERDPSIYGTLTLEEINLKIIEHAKKLGMEIRFFQSNSEGALIDFLQENRKWADAIVINPAAYTHTSIALRDTLEALSLPAVEVHLSKIAEREDFRKISFLKDVCIAQIAGLGWQSYTSALDLLHQSPSK